MQGTGGKGDVAEGMHFPENASSGTAEKIRWTVVVEGDYGELSLTIPLRIVMIDSIMTIFLLLGGSYLCL